MWNCTSHDLSNTWHFFKVTNSAFLCQFIFSALESMLDICSFHTIIKTLTVITKLPSLYCFPHWRFWLWSCSMRQDVLWKRLLWKSKQNQLLFGTWASVCVLPWYLRCQCHCYLSRTFIFCEVLMVYLIPVKMKVDWPLVSSVLSKTKSPMWGPCVVVTVQLVKSIDSYQCSLWVIRLLNSFVLFSD